MRTTLAATLAALATATLASPPAHAGHHTVDCDVQAYYDPVLTGQNAWYGSAWGSITGSPLESVSIRCVVTVNGVTAAATTWQSGTTTASTSDPVAWVATTTDVVEVCAQYVGSHGPGQTCFPVTVTPAGPGWIAMS